MRPFLKTGMISALLSLCLLAVALLFIGGFMMLRDFDGLGTQPPPVVKRYTLTLPRGIKLSVHKKFEDRWDDDIYEYTFAHGGKTIASSWEWNSDMPIKTGQSQNCPYFFQRKLIGIYSPQQVSAGKGGASPSQSQPWTVWELNDAALKSWWRNFEKAAGRNGGSGPEEMSDFGIEKFRAQGKIWNIVLHTGTSGTDWSQGLVPPYLHVVSTNSGQSWKVTDALRHRAKPKQ